MDLVNLQCFYFGCSRAGCQESESANLQGNARKRHFKTHNCDETIRLIYFQSVKNLIKDDLTYHHCDIGVCLCKYLVFDGLVWVKLLETQEISIAQVRG